MASDASGNDIPLDFAGPRPDPASPGMPAPAVLGTDTTPWMTAEQIQ
jgi:hypothetical protein